MILYHGSTDLVEAPEIRKGYVKLGTSEKDASDGYLPYPSEAMS